MSIVEKTFDELIKDEAALEAVLALADSAIDYGDIDEISSEKIRNGKVVTREERELRALGLDPGALRLVRGTDGAIIDHLNRLLKKLEQISRDIDRSGTSQDRTEVYKGVDGEYRWRRISPNGRVVGASSHSFGSRKACVANAERNASPSRIEVS